MQINNKGIKYFIDTGSMINCYNAYIWPKISGMQQKRGAEKLFV